MLLLFLLISNALIKIFKVFALFEGVRIGKISPVSR